MSASIHVARSICDLHGQCTYTAPELFWFATTGELQHQTEVPDNALGNAHDAAAACPVQAIEIRE